MITPSNRVGGGIALPAPTSTDKRLRFRCSETLAASLLTARRGARAARTAQTDATLAAAPGPAAEPSTVNFGQLSMMPRERWRARIYERLPKTRDKSAADTSNQVCENRRTRAARPLRSSSCWL
jgi:hypothetical protein